jgi:type II secretory pathway pseudopilin PulG
MNDTTTTKLKTPAREAGFSLIELLVVLVITFFIAGAIYGLLASGNNAFRKEPELADRQQNIRAAMDMITKDIQNAGAGLPAFSQIFTISDPAGGGGALNGQGPAGSMGPPAQALRNGDLSNNSDVLEMIEGDERCPALNVCSTVPVPGTANTFTTREGRPQCVADALNAGMGFLSNNLAMTVQPITSLPAAVACPGVVTTSYNGTVGLGAAVAVGTNPVAPAIAPPYFLVTGRVVRYRIAPDPTDAAPTLWRSVTGMYLPGTATVQLVPPGNNWQPVARGIEDLQVEYMDSGGLWMNAPNAAVPCAAPAGPCTVVGSYNPIVRQVRVTLSARVIAPGIVAQGASTAAGTGPTAVRGQLVSVTQPRAAMVALELGDQVR